MSTTTIDRNDLADTALANLADGENWNDAWASAEEELTTLAEGPVLEIPNTLAANRGTSSIEKPVAAVHAFVAAHPNMRRKDMQAALEAQGVNKWTARTQIQIALKGKPKVAPAHLLSDNGD